MKKILKGGLENDKRGNNKMEKEIKCMHCNGKNVYLFAVMNGVEVYDCKDCHRRTTLSHQRLKEKVKWKKKKQ